jgi:NAD-dependent deacetylase
VRRALRAGVDRLRRAAAALPHCHGILKSDTVSFGEPIPPDVLDRCFEEAEQADCMIVAGTSATVFPAAQFPISIHQRGGDLIEVNPYESEITALCRHAMRGPRASSAPPRRAPARARLTRAARRPGARAALREQGPRAPVVPTNVGP